MPVRNGIKETGCLVAYKKNSVVDGLVLDRGKPTGKPKHGKGYEWELYLSISALRTFAD